MYILFMYLYDYLNPKKNRQIAPVLRIFTRINTSIRVMCRVFIIGDITGSRSKVIAKKNIKNPKKMKRAFRLISCSLLIPIYRYPIGIKTEKRAPMTV